MLYIGICIFVWKMLSAKSMREAKPTDRALWKAIAVSLVFSPGLIVGHGALPGPAILGFLSGEWVVNLFSLFVVHPVTTGAARAWLRSQNGGANSCAGVTTYDRHPSARASFGVYSPESQRVIFTRELF